MSKVKKKRNTFKYNVDRKKLHCQEKKKMAPRIKCDQIRNAWDEKKSVAINLAEMGLAADPNKALPITKNMGQASKEKNKFVKKPHVIEEINALASLSSRTTMGVSIDMKQFVTYMVENYGEDCKAMARDEKNYYQKTPKQILRKIKFFRQHYPKEYEALLSSQMQQ
ncbi:LOW QUALITY PROTEIN: nucleolar protein 16-like [Bombina bombina]|uniref:LOW QUALITY PROTEIN: nucleolar protein 16-like n=1 Tax=Bombina bombina TaxID=8345 RepID=UPI00235B0063|nr:LOW QUALITY PROTEIN: nucleolar protein 16-like [Bombina bombina]